MASRAHAIDRGVARLVPDEAEQDNVVGVPAIAARGVSKSFAGERALDSVDFDLEYGEIHALLGANGSGKSTFIKVLAGYHKPEPGATIRVGGQRLRLGSSEASATAGLRFIHQDLALLDGLTVAENLTLRMRDRGGWWISKGRENRAVGGILERYGLHIRPETDVSELSTANRSMLAIIRAIESGLGDRGVLVLDEPTASLPPEEVDTLFALLRRLRARGTAILFVTHRLQEVFAIADRASVLRSGRLVHVGKVGDLDRDRLVELILGRPLGRLTSSATAAHGPVTLQVRALCGVGLSDVDLMAHQHEIVGLTGLLGSGYESVLTHVFGGESAPKGSVAVGGRNLSVRRPRMAIRAGMAFVPAERLRLAALGTWSVRENVSLPALRTRRGWLSARAERRDVMPWLSRMTVVPCDPEATFLSLSGGNQQKVVLARWLRCDAQVLLLDEPTIGVDAGAKLLIHQQLRELADGGATVVISSSDTEELSEVCDRVLVFGDGQVRTELTKPMTSDQIFDACLVATHRHAASAGQPPTRTEVSEGE